MNPKIGTVSNPHWRTLARGATGKDVAQRDAGEFDELCVGDWLHVEKMDGREWWMQIGDARVGVTVRKGKRPIVMIERGQYGPECSPETEAVKARKRRRSK